MGARCVSCLLQENDMFAKEVYKKIGCSIKCAKAEIEWLNKSSGVELGLGLEGSATRRISIGASPFDDSPANASDLYSW